MVKNTIYQEIINLVSKDAVVAIDELMSKHTSFRIGGPADIYIKAKNIDDIKKVLKYTKDNNIQLTIIGNGTNILVKDRGIRGIVLQIDIDNLQIDTNNKIVVAGAGIRLTYLAQLLLKNELKGFEFASGIPGTIGGGIKMNAGAHGKEMKDVVICVKYIDRDGNIHEITNEECRFKYRKSVFEQKDFIIIEAKLQLEQGSYKEIKKQMTQYSNYRKNAQPIEYPSAGSTFKRNEDFITAKLIDESGLKGYNINDAEVSTKHAGFIINKGNAKAEDVLKLMEIIKQKIKEEYGKEIELEIQIMGE